MKTSFFTICDTSIKRNRNNSRNIDFNGFLSSFSRFHTNIPMHVFDERDMAREGVNYYNAKATFGRILSKDYDLVVNVDADHYFFSRLDEILEGDYDIACPANYNVTDNLVSINVKSGLYAQSSESELISTKQFLQGGLIAGKGQQFWEHYEYATKRYANKFTCWENDVLNLVAYLFPYNVKILDGGIIPDNKSWYGCSIIGKEKDCYIENEKIMCEDKPVKAYHFAHGGAKKNYDQVFNQQVSEFIKSNILC